MKFIIKTQTGEAGFEARDAALAKGFTAAEIGAAQKAAAIATVEQTADGYRRQVISPSAAKHSAYRFKEEIAADPDNADPDELALIDREATARGLSRAELLALVASKAAQFRQIALLVEVIEAETKVAIAAIDDTATDVEDRIAAIFAAAKAEADAALTQALESLDAE